MVETVDFYGGTFSNFTYSPFVALDHWGRQHRYPTNEHYFQAWKANTQENHDYVLEAKTPEEAKQRGREIDLRPGWDEMKYDVMLEGLRHKFTLDYYCARLLETGDAEIRENSPTDFVWGYRNNGLNLLGKALMQIREEIRSGEFE